MSKVEPTQRALDQAAHDEEIKRLRNERDEAVALIHEIDLRFTSGNEVSVERARIKAHEWEQLRQALSRISDETMRHALFILRHGESPPEVTREDTIRRLERAIEGCSDEGTGCVVPEAVRRLPERWRNEDADYFGAPETLEARCALEKCANELDRAIAEQGEQSRIPVGLARLVSEWLADFPEGGDLDGFDQQAMMERAGIIEAMEITEIPCGDSCSCDEYGADVGDTCYRVTALGDKCRRIAAAPQPEHGESDARD